VRAFSRQTAMHKIFRLGGCTLSQLRLCQAVDIAKLCSDNRAPTRRSERADTYKLPARLWARTNDLHGAGDDAAYAVRSRHK